MLIPFRHDDRYNLILVGLALLAFCRWARPADPPHETITIRAESTCPYLQQVQQKSELEVKNGENIQPVLKNIIRLGQAETMFHMAEIYQGKGQISWAQALYEEIQRFCPGSHWENAAISRLRAIQTGKKGEPRFEDEEEQEITGPKSVATTEARILATELVKESDRAVMEGHYEEARALVEIALDLDSTSVEGEKLRHRLHLIGLREEKTKKTPANSSSEESLPPPKIEKGSEEDLDHVKELFDLLPHPEVAGQRMPVKVAKSHFRLLVEPRAVDALEKALLRLADPEVARLILKDNGNDAQGELARLGQGWPSDVPTGDLPGLFISTFVDDTSFSEAGSEEEEETAEDTPRSEEAVDWNDVIREAVDALRDEEGTPAFGNASDRLKVVEEYEQGAVRVQIVCDANEIHRGILVSWVPEASGDLRAGQRARNDRTLLWIESLNCLESLDAPDETNAILEEDTQDDEDVCFGKADAAGKGMKHRVLAF